MPTDDLQQAQPEQTSPVDPRRPWLVVSLLFVVALINYFDRQSLSVVAPRFQQELHLSDQGYGHVVSLFLLASAFAYAISGFISDALGTRRSMALFVGWWSLAEAATAFATSTVQLSLARFCLGLGEPGLWVAAPKAVGENFERPRRGLAIGIYTMGATVGAVIAIPVIAAITTHLPWKAIVQRALGLRRWSLTCATADFALFEQRNSSISGHGVRICARRLTCVAEAVGAIEIL